MEQLLVRRKDSVLSPFIFAVYIDGIANIANLRHNKEVNYCQNIFKFESPSVKLAY